MTAFNSYYGLWQPLFHQGRKRPFINGMYVLEAVLIYNTADRVVKYGRPLVNDGAILFCGVFQDQ